MRFCEMGKQGRQGKRKKQVYKQSISVVKSTRNASLLPLPPLPISRGSHFFALLPILDQVAIDEHQTCASFRPESRNNTSGSSPIGKPKLTKPAGLNT